MMVIDNVMYLIIYFYVNIMLVWLSSYICGIVLVELKLLQVICNRYVVFEPRRERERERENYSGGQKPLLKD